ncbi:carboxymuconolactone decarboxylase family protein [Micavibrio aeruginosavorus]|uniref:carboxymuconolactone decarboxylase family protein n=1 Tax=Micavibrio aeruginosavorus TaxID=349221 RepID=UPI003F4AE5A1
MSARIDYTKLSPQLYNTLYAMEKILGDSALEPTIMELVKIRASQLNGCLFCLDMHTKEARLHQERELRLHHLPLWRESTLFTDREKAALEWAELLTRIGPHGVSDEDFKEMSVHFSEKDISDLTFAIGCINMWNRLGVAFRPEAGGMDAMLGLDKAGLA